MKISMNSIISFRNSSSYKWFIIFKSDRENQLVSFDAEVLGKTQHKHHNKTQQQLQNLNLYQSLPRASPHKA